MIAKMHHFPMRSFDKHSVKSWKKTEEVERDTKYNASNVTMDTFYHQSSTTTYTQGEIANVTNERRISSKILVEMIKGLNGLTIQSPINDSEYYN